MGRGYPPLPLCPFPAPPPPPFPPSNPFPLPPLPLCELALKGVLSVEFPASLLGGFPCDSGPLNGRRPSSLQIYMQNQGGSRHGKRPWPGRKPNQKRPPGRSFGVAGANAGPPWWLKYALPGWEEAESRRAADTATEASWRSHVSGSGDAAGGLAEIVARSRGDAMKNGLTDQAPDGPSSMGGNPRGDAVLGRTNALCPLPDAYAPLLGTRDAAGV
jgi:hypothetical protein